MVSFFIYYILYLLSIIELHVSRDRWTSQTQAIFLLFTSAQQGSSWTSTTHNRGFGTHTCFRWYIFLKQISDICFWMHFIHLIELIILCLDFFSSHKYKKINVNNNNWNIQDNNILDKSSLTSILSTVYMLSLKYSFIIFNLRSISNIIPDEQMSLMTKGQQMPKMKITQSLRMKTDICRAHMSPIPETTVAQTEPLDQTVGQ